MELRQIEYFCTVSELGNFTRAAELLHVSQPSVTKAIKALEAELHLTLIDRSQKRIALTEEGMAFLPHGHKILQAVSAAQRDMQRLRGHGGGTIRFGLPPMVEAYLFPDFFMKFQAMHPSILLDVQEFGDSAEVLERTEDGSLDFGIVLGGQETRRSLPVLRDRMALCITKDHPLAERDQVSFEELRGERFILQQPSTFQYQQVFDRCAQSGYTPDIVLCTSQIKTIQQLVANEMGISILPDFVARMEKGFCRKPLVPPIHLQVSLAWSACRAMSATDELFVGFMREYTETPEFKREFRQE